MSIDVCVYDIVYVYMYDIVDIDVDVDVDIFPNSFSYKGSSSVQKSDVYIYV